MSEETKAQEPNEAVKSLLDIEHSTAGLDEFKGQPMFVINKGSRYPFSFGLAKAKLIMKHLTALQKFVDSSGKSLS